MTSTPHATPHPQSHPVPEQRRSAKDTKTRLLDAARQVVCDVGMAAASARTIAASAGANQALIFYHFGTVSELIEAASNRAVDQAVSQYRIALGEASTIDGLLAVGRQMHSRENSLGNVTFMAQILAAAPHDPVIARAARYAMAAWTDQVHAALDRVLGGTAVEDLIDLKGLAHLISAGFIGLELYGATNDQAATAALASLDSLGLLVDALGEAGPITRRAVSATIRHRT